MLVAALVLLTLPRTRQLQLSNVIRSTVLAPVLELQAWLADVRSMCERLESLRAERDSVTVRLVELQGVEEEAERLRALIQLAERAGARFRAANLYPAGRPITRSFVLDAGAAAGIASDAAVVAPAGLVGVVRAVTRWQAAGDFWTHSEFRVSAMTADGRVFGIVGPLAGTPPGMMLEGAPYQLELERGTLVVTSGLGGVFPRGIPIGRVEEPISAEEGWSRSYRVEPSVFPGAVQEVMVLVERPTADVGDIWEPEPSPEGLP